MKPDIINQLIELNRQFYQTFAADFSATRQRLQPGVRQILEQVLLKLPLDAGLLDLGCGNGELQRALQRGGFKGFYVGLDFSPGLLQFTSSQDSRAEFIQADLSAPGWDEDLPGAPFQAICAFAALHHLPGQALRQRTIQTVARLLAPGGRFIHSQWQFLNSPRLRQRIQDWGEIGLTPDQVEQGDYLLDWRAGGRGLRYVHHFSLPELEALAHENGFEICQTFYADGAQGNLALYQLWQLKESSIV